MIRHTYSKLVALAPKAANAIKHLPAGRAVYLVVLGTGAYTVGKNVYQFVKEKVAS